MSKRTTNTSDLQPRNMAGWIRLAAAAAMVPISPDTLARWIRRGEIPVSMRRFGPRLVYVSAPQFFAWRNHRLANVYTPEDHAGANDHCARGLAAEEVVDYRYGKPVTLEDTLRTMRLRDGSPHPHPYSTVIAPRKEASEDDLF